MPKSPRTRLRSSRARQRLVNACDLCLRLQIKIKNPLHPEFPTKGVGTCTTEASFLPRVAPKGENIATKLAYI
ncbi:hypothetical protein CANCADRAFT_132416 [Tortispora caseinolytica NRRL Y-17796]|uniref:Uncharacterized protein n=1 Tax=Tortispora caseinolytica NRRL Y-17796 TaxID=767744 RepID=A0A1E4TB28_9ASCO|nr:hypothetical protein CANCADRAFT_132416 [Tortispora caseinolytica NRRL Y-17796]